MPVFHNSRLFIVTLLLLAPLTSNAQSTLLDGLPTATQDAISQTCLPVQFREGATAYRNCVQAELDSFKGGGGNALAQLSFDDKYAVQQACAKAGSLSTTEYTSCVSTQINALNAIEEPNLDAISEDESYVVQQSCFSAQSTEGAAAYRTCINVEIASLLRIPAVDTSKLDTLKRNALQLRCSSRSSDAVQYRQCVAAEFESIAGTPPILQSVSTATAIVPAQQTAQEPAQQTAQEPAQQTAQEPAQQTAQAPAEPITEQTTTEQAAAPAVAEPNTEARQEPKTVASQSDTTQNSTQTNASDSTPVLAAGNASAPVQALPRNITPPGKDAIDATPADNVVALATTEATAATASDETTNTSQTDNVQAQTSTTPATQNTLRDATANTIAQSTTQPEQANAAVGEARVISRPGLAEEIELQERAKAQGIELADQDFAATSNSATETFDLKSKINGFAQSALDLLGSADRTAWLIIAGVLALPAILLGIFSLSKRTRRTDFDALEGDSSALADRIEPGMRTRRARQEQEAAEMFGDELPSGMHSPETNPLAPDNSLASANAQMEASIAHQTAQKRLPEHDAPTRFAVKPALNAQAEQQQLQQHVDRQQQHPATEQALSEQLAPRQSITDGQETELAVTELIQNNDASNITNDMHTSGWQSAFGSWLSNIPAQQRRETCVEFLIYWVAYSDKRYPPELRKRLFTTTELPEKDQIKRWVLKEDVLAFADVVTWLTDNSTPTQLDQSLELIMAVLVTENGVTPVQNTLLRFLADAFGIGINDLEQRFEIAYGHSLPPVPRPDKAAWWAKQPQNATTIWDARTMATLPEQDQMCARLGLPADHDEAMIMQAFRRAARRCHSDRFTELSDHERTLAEQQYLKFEQARDRLLGVTV